MVTKIVATKSSFIRALCYVLLQFYSYFVASGKQVLGQQCQESNDLIKSAFCFNESYNRDMPPYLNTTPLEISVSATFQDIVSINDDECTVTLDMILDITWQEPRLELISSAPTWNGEATGSKWIFLGRKQLNNLWRPELDIVNVKKFEINNVLEKQEYAVLFDSKHIMIGLHVQVTSMLQY